MTIKSLLLTLWTLQLVIITAKVDDAEKSSTTAEESSSIFTRHDRNAYSKAAGHPPTQIEHGIECYYGNLDKAAIQQHLRRKKTNMNLNKDDKDDPNNQCTTYLAPSSIPNSGLGMYTTIPYTKHSSLTSTFALPEIGIILQDKDTHYPRGEHKLLSQYPWGAGILTGSTHEVTSGSAIVPGLGMLANSHLGLANMRHDDAWRAQFDDVDGTNSLSSEGMQSMTVEKDVGRGANSIHSRVLFFAREEIQSGEELFVNYGDGWFTAREEWIGVVPSKENYGEADLMIGELFSGDEDNDDNGVDVDPQVYEELLKDAEKKDKRLRAAFPDNVEDLPVANEIGTARFSARSSIQSIEWLEENGACLDNLVSGTSTIPQAGRGAFATRNIHRGAVITTTPLITLEREALELWEEVNGIDAEGIRRNEDDKVMEMVGHQLLLNYCYGHTNSSLLLFPYAPTVNFINHGSKEEANAEIVWSSYPYHKGEWLEEMSIPEMKDLKKTGLMFDIVATKDISLGEEVLLYYGKDWENSWKEHIEDWTTVENEQDDVFAKNVTDTLGLHWDQQNNVDSIIWTVEEQKNQPYPPYLETVCRFQPPEEQKCKDYSNNDCYCTIRWSLSMSELHEHPCDVMSRSSIDGNDWYFVQMNITDSSSQEEKMTQYYVEFLPRYAIRLVNRKYTKDQYSRGVFREVIGLPDGIFPDHWMDLKEDDGIQM